MKEGGSKKASPKVSAGPVATAPLRLGREAESLLLNQEVDALVISLSESERPLRGLSARIDWRFRGAISKFVRTGAITGREGELIYLPVSRGSQLFHLFLVGVGKSDESGARALTDLETLKRIRKNVLSLGIRSVGASLEDLGISEPQARKSLEGVELCLVR